MVVIAIFLDGSDENKFNAGQNVTGNVRVETRDEIKMRGIRLEVHGNARVQWTEGTRKNRKTYRGDQNLLALKTYITGSDKDSEIILKPGVHTFPLSFLLPNKIPASFGGLHGSIGYKVQAIVDRAWKIDDSTELPITVIRLLNLNHEPPQLREPIVVHEEKPSVGCCYYLCCCIKGRPEIELRINRGCFVRGEKMILSGQVINRSNTKVTAITIAFMQEIEFCATWGGSISRRRNIYKTLGSRSLPQIESGGTDTWSDVAFTVPDVPASRLDGCRIINITYFIRMQVDFARGCVESVIRKDIIIGHIPLQGNSQSGGPITTQPSLNTSPMQSEFSEQSNHSGVHGAGLNQDNGVTSVGHR